MKSGIAASIDRSRLMGGDTVEPVRSEFGVTEFGGREQLFLILALDALSRLDSASGAFGSPDYAYDKNGNRTALNSTTYSYTPNSNRQTKIGTADVLLDANGNTLNKATWTFDYNAHNRMTASYDNATLKASYAYNGLGQRIQKLTPDNKGRYFLYGTNGELLAESDADGNLLNEYIFLNGQLLALYQPDDDNDGQSNAEEDPLNTNPAHTDSDGDGLRNTDEWYQTGTDARNPDSDGDGVLDGAEISAGTDPNNGTVYPGDGDVNQDGEVNVGDLLLVTQIALGQRIPTAVQQTHADINTDGVIDVRDVLKLQRRILGLSLLEWFNALPGAEQMLAVIERAFNFNVEVIKTANAAVANGKLFYVHVDHLGTPQALTNEAGTVVWSAGYDPFGSATVAPASTVEMNVRYPGQYYDSETGLHYNAARYYDPAIGRYLTADRLDLIGRAIDPELTSRGFTGEGWFKYNGKWYYDGETGQINHMYGYALQNPVNYIDPLGMHHKQTHKYRPPSPPLLLPNGNLWDGYTPQDGTCTLGPLSGIGNSCFPERCLRHDQCYEDNRCNASSWIPTLFGADRPCNQCNKDFFK